MAAVLSLTIELRPAQGGGAASAALSSGVSSLSLLPAPSAAPAASSAGRKTRRWLPGLRVCSKVLNRLRLGAGALVGHAELIEAVWGDDPDGGPVDAHNRIGIAVMSLRREGHPIATFFGRGYRAVPRFVELSDIETDLRERAAA